LSVWIEKRVGVFGVHRKGKLEIYIFFLIKKTKQTNNQTNRQTNKQTNRQRKHRIGRKAVKYLEI
jgi:hypothetical protein